MYQLYQIAFNNPQEMALLMQKYNLPIAENASELATAIDFATKQYGNNFVNDVANVQAQKNALNQSQVAYKNQLDSFTFSQLKDELIKWNTKLQQVNDIASREYILDKVAYIQKLMIQKSSNNSNENLFSSIHKNNQTLLLILTALSLMYIGSKIFKQ